MAYTNSPLVNYTRISPNSSNPRNNSIKKITIHHMAGNLSVETCGNVFAPTSRQASSNYGVGTDGRIGMYVEEKNRSWCSSSPANDHQAITIEVANDGGASTNWHVSDRALAATIKLCADICKRNGIAKLNYTGDSSGNLTRHNMFAATTCPGPYLQSKFPYIAAEVNKLLAGSVEPEPKPEPGKSTTYKVVAGDSLSKIGAKFGVSWQSIATANNVAGPKYIIYVGQVLTIPGVEEPKPAPSGDLKGKTFVSNNNVVYRNAADAKNSVNGIGLNSKYRGVAITATTTYYDNTVVLGNGGAVGFFRVSDITVQGSTPAPAPSVGFNKGDRVRVKSGAKTYTGGGLASFVYLTTYTILEQPKGDRVVIGIGTAVTAAVNSKDLYKA